MAQKSYNLRSPNVFIIYFTPFAKFFIHCQSYWSQISFPVLEAATVWLLITFVCWFKDWWLTLFELEVEPEYFLRKSGVLRRDSLLPVPFVPLEPSFESHLHKSCALVSNVLNGCHIPPSDSSDRFKRICSIIIDRDFFPFFDNFFLSSIFFQFELFYAHLPFCGRHMLIQTLVATIPPYIHVVIFYTACLDSFL